MKTGRDNSSMARNARQSESTDPHTCALCKDLLRHLGQFFSMLEQARTVPDSDWLTVEEIAKELKLSKSVVYRLIRNGELEAINVVDTNGRMAQRGHYRVRRKALKRYLEEKKVKALTPPTPAPSRVSRLPKVKNHLGL